MKYLFVGGPLDSAERELNDEIEFIYKDMAGKTIGKYANKGNTYVLEAPSADGTPLPTLHWFPLVTN